MSTKAAQGLLWSVAPSQWSNYFEPFFLPMYRKALDQLNPGKGTRLLDAGCGSGLFSSMAAATGAEVTGIDAAPGLLEIARRRNPKNRFTEDDLEKMPFEDSSFDVVTGFNSFQYAGDFENTLNEAKRILKKNGYLLMGFWDKPELSDATQVLMAISALLPLPPPGKPGPFALSEDGKVEGILKKHQLELVYTAKVACPFLYRNVQEGVKGFMGTGPAAAALNSNKKEIVEKTIAVALKPFQVVDDMHFLQNSFLIFIAKKV